MNYFIKQILIFTIPLTIFFSLLELSIRNIPNFYKHKISRIYTNAESIKTLIIGNSYALYGINPEYLDNNAFNMSMAGQSLYYDYKILQKTVDTLKNLDCVILNLSYFSLHYTLEKSQSRHRQSNYSIYYKIKPKKIKYYTEILSGYPAYWQLVMISDYYIKGKRNSYPDNGCLVSEDTLNINNLNKLASSRATMHNKYIKQGVNDQNENKEYLEKIIRICLANNLKLILITIPTTSAYQNLINLENLELIKESYKEVISGYPNTIYLDKFNCNEFEHTDFFDDSHLNKNGARKLTQKINEYIN